jgi:hypothetical protein
MSDDVGPGNGQALLQSRGSSICRFAKWITARHIGPP